MERSKDYMSHYYDDLFNSEYGGKSEKEIQEEKRKNDIENLVRRSPKRMLPILGAVLGDFIGSRFEHDYPEFVQHGDYKLIDRGCTFTDDTVFTIGVTEAFVNGNPTSKGFTDSLINWGRKYPNAGFGRGTQAWIASDSPQPYGSNRNGAAMRVAPCACFASTLDDALELARVSAEVSHNSPEGVAGAQAIAAGVFMAINKASKQEIKDYISAKFGYALDKTMTQLHSDWSGFSCKASDTVPQAIICFLQGNSVEDAIRHGISLCSDADTLASMAAAIATPYYGQLPDIFECLTHLPDDIITALASIRTKICQDFPENL